MQAGEGRPSYDELAALVAEQARVIAELRGRVAALEAENTELKRRLHMGELDNVRLIRSKRKDLARMLTVLGEQLAKEKM